MTKRQWSILRQENIFCSKAQLTICRDYIQEETTVEEIVNKLLKVYDVDKNECLTSVIQFLEQLKENGFIDIK